MVSSWNIPSSIKFVNSKKMDSELQAIRDARLAQLKSGSGNGPNTKNSEGSAGSSSVGAGLAPFLQPQALERLSRVNLVRPDRAKAVEQYLKQIIGSGQVSHKITEEEIVQILNGIAREQNKQNETKIIFNRRETDFDDDSTNTKDDDSEDDFFDE